MLDDVSETDVKLFQAALNSFRLLGANGINQQNEKEILRALDFYVPFITNLSVSAVFTEVKRLTINKNVVKTNSRIYNIKNLTYPPANKVSKYGRCNLPSQSILYATFYSIGTLSEMKPKVGDLITESTWRVKDNQPIRYCPIFKNQPLIENTVNPRSLEYNHLYNETLKKLPINLSRKFDSLIQFVTDEFTKNVDPNNHLNYIFSAYFSNRILNELEDGNIEAIYYPSVPEKLTFENLAIKPKVFDKKYELVKVKDSIVVSSPENGGSGCLMVTIGDCDKFDTVHEKVLWDSNTSCYRLPPEQLIQLKKSYTFEL